MVPIDGPGRDVLDFLVVWRDRLLDLDGTLGSNGTSTLARLTNNISGLGGVVAKGGRDDLSRLAGDLELVDGVDVSRSRNYWEWYRGLEWRGM
jgi:hypothetical protein